MSLDLCKISDASHRAGILECAETLEKRRGSFLTVAALQDLVPLPIFPINGTLSEIEQRCEDEAVQSDEDGKGENRQEIKRSLAELKARKWVSEQKAAIENEIERQKHVALLE